MFTIIIASICNYNKLNCCKKLDNDSSSNDKRFNSKKVITAIVLSITFGFGWGLGFAATSHSITSLVIAFQAIFTVVVGFHGLLMFIFHGVRSPEVQGLWKSLLCTVVKRRKVTQSAFSETRQTTLIRYPSTDMLKSLSRAKTSVTSLHGQITGSLEMKIGLKATQDWGITVEWRILTTRVHRVTVHQQLYYSYHITNL